MDCGFNKSKVYNSYNPKFKIRLIELYALLAKFSKIAINRLEVAYENLEDHLILSTQS